MFFFNWHDIFTLCLCSCRCYSSERTIRDNLRNLGHHSTSVRWVHNASILASSVISIKLLLFDLLGPHLLVAKSRSLVGSIASKHLIWRLEQNAIHPFARSVLHLTEQQQQDEKVYLQMLSEVLSLESFYYSTTYDLTHSMQRLTDTSPDFRQLGLFERVSFLLIFYS